MDASRPARGFVVSGVRVSAAAIHPVSTARAAGPDEFRGSAPDHIDGLFRPQPSAGSADPGPTAHAILDVRPPQPVEALQGRGDAPRPKPGTATPAVTLPTVPARLTPPPRGRPGRG